MNKSENDEFSFTILKHFGVLKEGKWNLEANLVKFGDNEPKLDIRKWNPDHTKMSKGISLDKEEFDTFMEIMVKYDNPFVLKLIKKKKKINK